LKIGGARAEANRSHNWGGGEMKTKELVWKKRLSELKNS